MSGRKRIGKLHVALLAICLVVLGSATSSQAVILGPPDIFVEDVAVTYDAGPGPGKWDFSAIGTALHVDVDGVAPPNDHGIDSGVFELLATINNDGDLLGGTLSITGAIPGLGIFGTSTTLLSGILTDLGPGLDFLVSVTGGALSGAYGAQAYVSLVGFSGYPGNFENDFTGFTAWTDADVWSVVPAPSALLLGCMGLLCVTRTQRRVPDSN